MPEERTKIQALIGGLHIPCQVVVAAVCLYWFWHPPLPNKAVLILTGVTVVMALLEMRTSHKIIYLLLVLCLMAIENRAINKDREETSQAEDERGKEEREEFRKIANGIGTAIDDGEKQFKAITLQNQIQFAATMQRSARIFNGVSDSIKTQTGGDSFAFISFTAEPAQSFEMRWNDLVAPRGKQYFSVSITSHGKYPLHGTHAILMDDEYRLAAMQEYNKHPNGDWMKAINSADTQYQIPYLRPQSSEAPTGDVNVIGLYPIAENDSKKVTVNFSAPNGYWNEVLHLGRIKGIWHQCLSVMGPTVNQMQHPFVYCDSDWPEGKALAEKDWKPVVAAKQ